MTKETFLILAAIFTLLSMHSTAFCAKSIQTSQHIIVLDPGHGGEQNGLITPTGLTEKNITLKIARKIAQKLENSYNVHLTRTFDTQKSPRERMLIANRFQADLFISIHLHNSNSPAAFFYHFNFPEKEGPRNIVQPTWKSNPIVFQKKSEQVAKIFSKKFSEHKPSLSVHIKKAPVFPLEGSTMPAILMEPFAISSLPRHPARLEIILEEYAQLTANAIEEYFNLQ